MGYGNERTGTTAAVRGLEVVLDEEDDRAPTDDEVKDAILSDLRSDLLDQAAKRFRAWPHEVGYALISAVAGDTLLGPRLGKMFRKAGVHAKAAEVYENLGDWTRAARCHEKAKRFDLAAECFARADAPLDAARMFEAAESWDHAARIFLEAGEPLQAARVLVRTGALARAVELCLEARRPGEAAKLVRAMSRETNGYWEAELLVVHALDAAGATADAIALANDCLRGVLLSSATQAALYQLARILERTGNVKQAHRQYSKLAAFDPGYRDVGLRAATTSGFAT